MDSGVAARYLISTSAGASGNLRRPKEAGSEAGRKRLSDITNIVNSGRLGISGTAINQENANALPCPSPNDYITQVLKENTSLLKLVAERNKIIEASSIELQKLRIELRKTSQQNWHLARLNSQMLGELNLGKDRLKLSQHELGIAAAVIKQKTSEIQNKERLIKELLEKLDCKDGSNTGVEIEGDVTHPDGNRKDCKTAKTRKLRNQDSNIIHPFASKERANRTRTLKSSSKLNSEVCESVEDSLKVEGSKSPDLSLVSEQLHEHASDQPGTIKLVESSISVGQVASNNIVNRRRSTRLSDKPMTQVCETADDSQKIDDMKLLLTEASYQGGSPHLGSSRPGESAALTREVTTQRKLNQIRKSSRSRTGAPKTAKIEPVEDLVKREVKEFPFSVLNSDLSHEEASSESNSSFPPIANSILKLEKNEEQNLSGCSQSDNQEMRRRPSVGRPSRKAAEKISSYREISLKVKLRRLE